MQGDAMTILTPVDPSAEIACTLPINEAKGRLGALQALVGDRLAGVERDRKRLRIRIARDGDTDLDADATEWAEAEKRCCAFLGFAIESQPDHVTLEIAAPPNAGPALDVVEFMVRAAGRGGAA
jgi:hypothetical protein